jgi:hypothetical protein
MGAAAWIIASAIAITACAPTPTASCLTHSAPGVNAECLEVYDDVNAQRLSGTGCGDTFTMAQCPRNGRVGGCHLDSGAGLTTWYYAASGYTEASVRAACTGTFVTP